MLRTVRGLVLAIAAVALGSGVSVAGCGSDGTTLGTLAHGCPSGQTFCNACNGGSFCSAGCPNIACPLPGDASLSSDAGSGGDAGSAGGGCPAAEPTACADCSGGTYCVSGACPPPSCPSLDAGSQGSSDALAESGTAPDAGCGDAGRIPFVSGTAACLNEAPMLLRDAATGYSTCTPTAQSAGTRSAETMHRPSIVKCPNLLVPASAGSCTDPSGTCTSNAGCADAGPNAACTLSTGGIPGYCECRAGCLSDSDCKAGEVCLCGDPLGGCVPARCTSDQQCGSGFLCAFSSDDPSGTCGVGVQTFACQTAQDTCLLEANCSDCNTTASCGLDDAGHRACSAACPKRVGP